MISSGKDVIRQGMMYDTCKELLAEAIDAVIKSKGEEQLPLNIVILRSSGGDGWSDNLKFFLFKFEN